MAINLPPRNSSCSVSMTYYKIARANGDFYAVASIAKIYEKKYLSL